MKAILLLKYSAMEKKQCCSDDLDPMQQSQTLIKAGPYSTSFISHRLSTVIISKVNKYKQSK